MTSSIKFLIFFLTCIRFLYGSEQDRLFYDAVRAEASGDTDLAIKFYLQASQIAHTANLHGNLANLYFEEGKFGHSILHFRKAILLNSENSELSTNLAFAYEKAGVQNAKSKFSDTYLSADFLPFWIIILNIVIWFSVVLVIYIFFFKESKRLLFYSIPILTALFVLSSYAVHFSSNQKALKLREIIVLHSSDSNNTNIVQLRRFAGEKSLANTSVSSGESLIVDLDENKKHKFHKVSNGDIWYLVRSSDNKKKGWIKEDEFGWLIEPKS